MPAKFAVVWQGLEGSVVLPLQFAVAAGRWAMAASHIHMRVDPRLCIRLIGGCPFGCRPTGGTTRPVGFWSARQRRPLQTELINCLEQFNSRIKIAFKSLVTKGTLVQVKKPKSATAKNHAAKKSHKKAKKPAATAAKKATKSPKKAKKPAAVRKAAKSGKKAMAAKPKGKPKAAMPKKAAPKK
ncbi:histone H1-like [Rhinichthys klamathensis goyatoka]|uniref:histone H1-like n=1 Tax=Rhinichthys klamathensis goyatoka TaxID=3034132 RepID=UPI0024B62C29|nr:histone H1-like [Rhinichthys klamathensis goyatoka]